MCGILAVVSGGGPLDVSSCRRALSALSWRGPDRCVSSVWDDRVFLGQTVLSLTGTIADSTGRHASSVSGRYAVAYNGEIYNFRQLAAQWLSDRLQTDGNTTDTEILANLHEVLPPEGIPERLDGMFAYVVFDRQLRRLYVCRDVQGEKSLYLHQTGEAMVIASEIPAIRALAGAGDFDRQVFRDYFRTRHLMLFDRTVFTDVRELEPGCLEAVDLTTGEWARIGKRSLADWIDPVRFEANRHRPIDDLADELEAILVSCLKEMRPEGRRFAAVVSGGVDSSLIAYYLVRDAEPDHLVAVDHIGKDRISSDLSGFEEVLGRPIDVLRVNEVPFSAEIARCQHHCGSPLPAHSFVPQSLQSARVRASGCRAIFGGEGGDGFWGGYEAFLRQVEPARRFSPSPYTACDPPEVEFADDNPGRIEQVLAGAWARSIDVYAFVEDLAERLSLAQMYCDGAYQLATVGLRGADLMSMMWSVEARAVLVRRPVLEFALTLPLAARIDPAAPDPALRTKVLLKRLFLRHYPARLLVEKQGFAGFPNESAAYLGASADYLIYDVLGMRPPDPSRPWGRSVHWKVTNVEYFLRSLPEFVRGPVHAGRSA